MTTIDARGNLHDGAGQFAEKHHSAPTGLLSSEQDAGDRDWGAVDLREGSRTPWGGAQWVTDLGPGAASVSTAGHGGVKLSKERNAAIPAALRNAGGWYEEDCEVYIVGMYHPDLKWAGDGSIEERRADFEQGVKRWFPDKWEKATGGAVLPGESSVRDEQLFEAEHREDFLVRGASKADSDPDLVRVTARRASDGVEEEFLVPAEEYKSGRDGKKHYERFVVDPTRHRKLPPKAPREGAPQRRAAKADPSMLSASALSQAYIDGAITGAQRDRAAKDLGKAWRAPDGSVRTLRDIVASQEVGLTADERGGRMTYSVRRPSGHGESSFYSYPVSKATYDVLRGAGVPDSRTPVEVARHQAGVLEAKAEKLKAAAYSAKDRERAAAALQEAERARAEHKRLWDEDMAAARGAQESIQASNAARERAATLSP